MVDDLSQVDTSRRPEKPDLRPLPDHAPDDPTDHGWSRGLRDWYWSVIRQWLHIWTDGAANYTDRYYEMGYTVLEVLEKRARDRALAFPSDEAREWFAAGLKAASFSVGEEDEILFQGPGDLPDRFFGRAMGFVVRRADRALDLYGEETDSVDRDLSALEGSEGKDPEEEMNGEQREGGEAEHGTGEQTGESPAQEEDETPSSPPPEQGTLF